MPPCPAFAHPEARPLAELLGEGTHCIALTGGGGKTSLMFALAAHAAAQGERVLCATTTRIRPPEAGQCAALLLREAFPDDAAFMAAVAVACLPGRVVVAADRELPGEHKLAGLPPELMDALADALPGARILVEADGAAGRPLKAPAPHEPVIPACTDAVLGLMGLDSLGEPLNGGLVHRPERLAALAGCRLNDRVTPAVLARLATHPEGLFRHAPPRAARLAVCTKAELGPALLDAAEDAAGLCAALPAPAFQASAPRWFAASVREGWALHLGIRRGFR